MARKFELRPGKYMWGLERCEDTVLFNAWLSVREHMGPEHQELREFISQDYIERGLRLGEHYLEAFNRVLARRNIDRVILRETMATDYVKMAQPSRAEARRHLFQILATADRIHRQRLADAARIACDELPDPAWTLEDWKRQREPRRGLNPPSRPRPVIDVRPQPRPDLEKFARLIGMAASQEVQDKIIASVPVVHLEEFAVLVQDQSVRDRVIAKMFA